MVVGRRVFLDLDEVERAWGELSRVVDTSRVVPVTYMNSWADLKAFCGENGGAACTSSNATRIFEWAFSRGERILFFPDEHLGRNAGRAMGIPSEAMPVFDPRKKDGGLSRETVEQRFDVKLPAGRASSIGGLLVELAGRIPAAGERFLLQGLEIDVLAASPARVERLLIRQSAPPPVTLGQHTS